MGDAKTATCTRPTMNRASTFPVMRVVGLSVVRIISVTLFSFSSRVEFSICPARSTTSP
ncbi:hypothetical protein D9M72_617640 [compost metagenome]